MAPGTYRLTFATGEWFAAERVEGFYPEVTVIFAIHDRHDALPCAAPHQSLRLQHLPRELNARIVITNNDARAQRLRDHRRGRGCRVERRRWYTSVTKPRGCTPLIEVCELSYAWSAGQRA